MAAWLPDHVIGDMAVDTAQLYSARALALSDGAWLHGYWHFLLSQCLYMNYVRIMQSLTINSGIPMAFLSYHPPWSIHCLSSSMGGCAPYTSSAGMFRSSTKITYFLPSGGPKTPLRLQCRTLLRNCRDQCGYKYRYGPKTPLRLQS